MMAKSLDDTEKQKTAFGKFDYREIAKQYKFKKLDAPQAKKIIPADVVPDTEALEYLSEMYEIPQIDVEA